MFQSNKLKEKGGKKRMKRTLAAVTLLMAFVGCAWGAPSKKEIDAMSLFLSNFTELGFLNVTAEEMAEADNYAEAVRFGVEHNFVNNFKSRIVANKGEGRKYGAYRVSAKHVAESVKKYLALDIEMDQSAESDPPYFFDGKNFNFNKPDLGTIHYAKVQEVEKGRSGVYSASGIVYNVKKPKEILGKFKASFRDYVWKGKKTYSLISLESD